MDRKQTAVLCFIGSLRIGCRDIIEEARCEFKRSIAFDSRLTGDAKNRAVRFDRLSLALDVPVKPDENAKAGPGPYRSVTFDTELEVREGQLVVVGKSGAGNGTAIIAVMSVQIIE
jgi:hypothetical protein